MQILCAKSVPDKKEAGGKVSGSGALSQIEDPEDKNLLHKLKRDAYFFSLVQICQIPRHCCCSHFGYFSCYGQSTVVKRLAS